jgi:hypothetical protein
MITMTIEQKGKMIGEIISVLRHTAEQQQKPFDGGDTFLSLCFKSDEELKKIAKLAGI